MCLTRFEFLRNFCFTFNLNSIENQMKIHFISDISRDFKHYLTFSLIVTLHRSLQRIDYFGSHKFEKKSLQSNSFDFWRTLLSTVWPFC